MEQLIGILARVLVFAFVAGMFTLVFVMDRRRRRENKQIDHDYAQLARIAPERGWTYYYCAGGQLDQYSGVGPFPGVCRNMRAWHYTTGEIRGRSFKFFEYRYIDPLSNDSSGPKHPTIESVFIITTPGSAPSMEIYHPDMLDSIADWRTKVELGVPEFDKEFRIATKDEAFARAVLHGELVSFLLTDPRTKASRIALRDDVAVTWFTGTMSAKAADEKLNYLCDVLERIPAQAWTTG
jgi:hypothetical protein